MTDPAAAAAQRAWDNWIETWAQLPPYFSLATASACEALKPIRELHHRTELGWCFLACVDEDGHQQALPCDTAKLAYPESEL